MAAADDPLGNAQRTRRKLAVLALLLAAGFSLFYRLDYPLFEPDETRNAQLALTMLETGGWLSPQLNGRAYRDKPPLLAWLTAISYRCLGTSEFATRLPTTFASFLTIVLTLTLGQKLVGFRAACIASGVLTLCGGFVAMGRYVTMDALLTLWTTSSLLLGFHVIEHRPRRIGNLIWAGIFIGLGIMTKGPVAAVICLPSLLIFAFLKWRNRSQERKQLYKATLVLAGAIGCVAAPWFIFIASNEPDFLGDYIWTQHVLRYSDAFVHRQPFWYYLPAALVMMFPASYLLPSTVWFVASRHDSVRNCRLPAVQFLALAVVWIFAFFTLSDSKLPTYILPAIPLLCLIMGAMLDKTVLQGASTAALRQSFLPWIPSLANIGLLVTLAILSTLIVVQWPEEISSAFVSSAGFLVSLVVVIIRPGTQRNATFTWISTAALAWLTLFVGLNHLLPAIAAQRSVMMNAATLRNEHADSEAPIVYFGRDDHATSMHLNPESVFHFDEKNLAGVNAFLMQHPSAIIVSADHQLAKLNAHRRRNSCREFVFQAAATGRHLYMRRTTEECHQHLAGNLAEQTMSSPGFR